MSALTKGGKIRKRVGPGASIADRLELHTEVSEGGCIVWTAHRDRNGYGKMSLGGKLQYVHRVAYEAAVGPIPPGMQIDHLCRNTSCCNVGHLEAVSPQVNMLRGTAPGAIAQRRDDCLYGHPYADFGALCRERRICRVCKIMYARLWRQIPYAEAMRRKHSGETVVDLGSYLTTPFGAAEAAQVCADLLREVEPELADTA